MWPSALRWVGSYVHRPHHRRREAPLLSRPNWMCTGTEVNISTGPPGSKVRWFRSSSDQPKFTNTVTFGSKDDSPTLVMVHGYGASQGFFFRNFDVLASRFRVIAIDQLGTPDWKVPTTFIYGYQDWMNYQGAQLARKDMRVPISL